MLPRCLLAVNLAQVLAGCVSPKDASQAVRPAERAVGPTREVVGLDHRFESSIAESIRLGHIPPPEIARHIADLGPSPPPPPSTSVMSGLGASLTDVTVDMDRGQTLLDYVAANIPDARWSRYGVMALTAAEIFGDDTTTGVCEEGAVIDDFDQDGQSWEASYATGMYGLFLDGPTAEMESLGASCKTALAMAGGDVDAALASGDCDEFDEHTFFPEDSACRSCLEAGSGDYGACTDSGDCPEEAPYTQWIKDSSTGDKMWFQTATAQVWACAPDLPSNMFVMGNIAQDGTLPAPFDHADWAFFCTGYWDDSSNAVVYSCADGSGGWQLGDTVGEGALGRVNYIRPVGDTDTPHFDRLWYSPSVSIADGPTLDRFWATAPGSAQISMPAPDIRTGQINTHVEQNPVIPNIGAVWSLNPYALRPDGTDPANIDDTYARDWLATLTLKTATTITGILINTYNHNRCASWEGPFSDGSYRCTALVPPAIGWAEDSEVNFAAAVGTPGGWADPEFLQYRWLPMATLGSTGLADSDVPGGITVELAGTAALADPDWDSASWPVTWIPDAVPYEATYPGYGEGQAVWGDTYRFGAHPDLDLRVVLNTNQLRGFRPEEAGFSLSE